MRSKIIGAVFLCAGAVFAAHMIESDSWADAGKQVDKEGDTSAEKLIQGSDCLTCHAVDNKVLGPAFRDIADKYSGQAGAADKLAKTIREGGAGNWGDIPMPPHLDLADAQLKEIVNWILSQKDMAQHQTGEKPNVYEYTKEGKTIKLDFQLFTETKGVKVTKDVLKGYDSYSQYCMACHGADATQSDLAPDLRHSVETGMTMQKFVSVAVAGREDRGMPPWSGFLSEDEIRNIYKYVKGRSTGLISVGRPPSEGE